MGVHVLKAILVGPDEYVHLRVSSVVDPDEGLVVGLMGGLRGTAQRVVGEADGVILGIVDVVRQGSTFRVGDWSSEF